MAKKYFNRRTKHKMIYHFWYDEDPNDVLEVAAYSYADACVEAMSQLKWCLSINRRKPETPEEKEMCE